jgi:hypothetical protein
VTSHTPVFHSAVSGNFQALIEGMFFPVAPAMTPTSYSRRAASPSIYNKQAFTAHQMLPFKVTIGGQA